MIDITRSTRFKVQISEIDFKSIINESVTNLRGLEGAHKLVVKTTIESYLPFYSDCRQLQVIFNNLISNAIKYQHAHEMHPELGIHIEVDSDKAVMTFKDNGVGISKENIGKVFDMFFRAPGIKADGSGLGLYIVKEIVRKLKGKILVASKENEGSGFQVELPNKIDPDLLRKVTKLVQNSK
jgi:signal transduction histidine kinase